MSLRMQRYDKDCMRLMRGPRIVGFLLRRTDERWGIYDMEERPLTKRSSLQAGMARDAASELIKDT